MDTITNNQPAKGCDGVYNFTMSYADREVECRVEKQDDILNVHMEDWEAKLQVEPDGSVHQIGGNKLPGSNVQFIRKEVLGHEC